MFSPSRRLFLGASVAGLASYPLFGDEPAEGPAEPEGGPGGRPVPAGHPVPHLAHRPDDDDGRPVGRRPRRDGGHRPSITPRPRSSVLAPALAWRAQKTVARPYPLSDFKVFRAELTGLAPGTDYTFKIGKQSPTYRFRTMPAKATDAITFVSGGDCGVNAAAAGEQRPGRPPGPDVRRRRRRPGVRQRQVGRDEPGVPEELQPDDGRPGRPADPAGRGHRQPRGGRRVRQAPREGDVLLPPVRAACTRRPGTPPSTSATT